jgi:prephenate dehydrogenase
VRWKKVSLIGVGLLGGSLGLALRKGGLSEKVVGFVRRPGSIRECERVGAVEKATLNLEEAVLGADLIVLCTPIAQMRPLVDRMFEAIGPGTVITDVGSVKACIVRDLEPIATRAQAFFIGSHPMAGAEKMGVASARADLFEKAVCVVTQTRRSNPTALKKVENLWKAIGCRVILLEAEMHDALVSRSSHLPHLVAATLVNRVLDPKAPKQQADLCANGFRDTTRIASGSPEMWRDIAMANRKHIGESLTQLIRDLQKVQRLISKADMGSIERFLTFAKLRRDKWQELGGGRSEE